MVSVCGGVAQRQSDLKSIVEVAWGKELCECEVIIEIQTVKWGVDLQKFRWQLLMGSGSEKSELISGVVANCI